MKLDIVLYPDPRLGRTCEPVAEITPEIKQLAEDMLETMYAAPGVGLAAPQVGRLISMVVYDPAEKDQPKAAEECVKNVRSLIAEKRKTVCLFISHNRLDDISQEIAKAYECIAEKDVNGFLVYCRSAITLTADMREMELPLLYNLL